MKTKKSLGIAFILVGIGLIVWTGVTYRTKPATTASTPTPLWQAEPLVPTALPTRLTVPSVPASNLSTRQPTETRLPVGLEAITLPLPASANILKRFGVGVPFPPLTAEIVEKLGLGWYLTWQVTENPPRPEGIEFWQIIRVHEAGFHPNKATIHRAVKANPGATWIIGNEPDVIWQDNVTPARYAKWYHELYYLLKEADPTCQVAIGGVTQPTPLRLQYLELVLSAYQTRYGEVMPIDVWNIHNFILREERGSWGVDIPPGLAPDQGILFEVDDHDDLEIFKAQIITFRRWLANHGQRDKPLVVSEYGILMPTAYGFEPEQVQQFLHSTYDFMLNSVDAETGYPADDNRLVQRWAWYSLSDNRYSTGNFIDFETRELTDLGKAHQNYLSNLP